MRRLASFVLLVSTLAIVLCSCHGKREILPFKVPENFDTSREYEITFWAKNDTNLIQTRVYENAIESFEELYPNIKVNMKLYTDYSRIYNDVITNISTNTTPNVCITYPDHIATYMSGSEVVVPLDSLISNKKYGLGGEDVLFDGPTREEIIPKFLEELRIGDYVYALPFMRSSEAVYINKDLVEGMGYEIPEVLTWDFIWEVSEAAMAKDEEGRYLCNGDDTLIPFIYKSSDNMMIQILKQMDAPYSNSEGSILMFNDEARDVLFDVASHVSTGAFSTFTVSGYPGNFFNQGQCIFAIDSTAGATWIGTASPHSDIDESQIIEVNTVVRPVPQIDPNNMEMISQGPSVCIFNKEDPQEVLASWLFTQYLLTNEVQIGYASTEGYIPVTSKAHESEEYISYLSGDEADDKELYYGVKLDATKMLLDNIENTFITPVFNGSTALRASSGDLIDTVVKSVRRKETIDSAYMENLMEKVYADNKLDQIETKDLGKLPALSVVMLCVLGVTWVIICAYVILLTVKKHNKT